jgi:hypothetical protein
VLEPVPDDIPLPTTAEAACIELARLLGCARNDVTAVARRGGRYELLLTVRAAAWLERKLQVEE